VQKTVAVLSQHQGDIPDTGKLAAMIAGANLILCTDGAPMHLAVAVQTYTIALFGPTEPQKLLPASDRTYD